MLVVIEVSSVETGIATNGNPFAKVSTSSGAMYCWSEREFDKLKLIGRRAEGTRPLPVTMEVRECQNVDWSGNRFRAIVRVL